MASVAVTPLPTPSPHSTLAGTITITAFPAAGALTPISGVVTGLVAPTAYVAVLYVRDAFGANWVSWSGEEEGEANYPQARLK